MCPATGVQAPGDLGQGGTAGEEGLCGSCLLLSWPCWRAGNPSRPWSQPRLPTWSPRPLRARPVATVGSEGSSLDKGLLPLAGQAEKWVVGAGQPRHRQAEGPAWTEELGAATGAESALFLRQHRVCGWRWHVQ